jgi:chaperonin GroEL (HSP60 family)
VFTGKIVDMRKENVLEPLRVSKQIMTSAAETAMMIIRIDDVIAAKTTPMGGPEAGRRAGEEGFEE